MPRNRNVITALLVAHAGVSQSVTISCNGYHFTFMTQMGRVWFLDKHIDGSMHHNELVGRLFANPTQEEIVALLTHIETLENVQLVAEEYRPSHRLEVECSDAASMMQQFSAMVTKFSHDAIHSKQAWELREHTIYSAQDILRPPQAILPPCSTYITRELIHSENIEDVSQSTFSLTFNRGKIEMQIQYMRENNMREKSNIHEAALAHQEMYITPIDKVHTMKTPHLLSEVMHNMTKIHILATVIGDKIDIPLWGVVMEDMLSHPIIEGCRSKCVGEIFDLSFPINIDWIIGGCREFIIE